MELNRRQIIMLLILVVLVIIFLAILREQAVEMISVGE